MSHTRIRPLFSDLLGLPRGKFVPPHVADGGKVGFAGAVFAVTYDRDLLNVPGAGVLEGIPDVHLELDSERRKAWEPHVEVALGDLYSAKGAFPLCPRSALKRAIAGWQAKGLKPMVGLELEAYVFQRDEDGVWRPYETPGAFVYGTGPANDPLGLVEDIWQAAYDCDLAIESMNGEYDNGQFELTLCFADALKACDDAFLFKALAREVALKKGLILTFMPKPHPERGGSGMHINFSFVDESGANVIAPHGELSEIAQGCIAGLLEHHEGLAGLLAPTVNSYARLAPGSMAGYWANWAEDHRMVTVRSSTSSPKSARLEHRTADCSANPYIAVAAVLQAALLGVDRGYKMPKAEDLDGIENVRATRHVPSDLPAAMTALEKDKALSAALGQTLCEAQVVLKRDEAERLKGKSVDEIRDFYLPFV